MKYLILFLNWLKKSLAKETLFALFALPLAVFLSWLMDKIFLGYSGTPENLGVFEIGIGRYWVYLVFTFLAIIYGIRFVEVAIKIVFLKKEKKD